MIKENKSIVHLYNYKAGYLLTWMFFTSTHTAITGMLWY